MPTDADLAALIGSRICHDLISPIGAINNGLELLTMAGEAPGPEMGLIGESVGSASARIRFFRIAFGAAGQQMVGPGEVASILRENYEGGRLTLRWESERPHPRAQVRLVFLALLCLETALPYGGTISVSETAGRWQLIGRAERIGSPGPLWDLLEGEAATPGGELLPAHVQFALLPRALAQAGRALEQGRTAAEVRLAF